MARHRQSTVAVSDVSFPYEITRPRACPPVCDGWRESRLIEEIDFLRLESSHLTIRPGLLLQDVDSKERQRLAGVFRAWLIGFPHHADALTRP